VSSAIWGRVAELSFRENAGVAPLQADARARERFPPLKVLLLGHQRVIEAPVTSSKEKIAEVFVSIVLPILVRRVGSPIEPLARSVLRSIAAASPSHVNSLKTQYHGESLEFIESVISSAETGKA